jgi:aminoglycoside phosphotransferase (APT) family kinase protein
MSTIGHPLSDLVNPYITANNGPNRHPGFKTGATPGLPTQAQVATWYGEIASWNPVPDLTWGTAFSMFGQSCIMQGIAARVATRQASSQQAHLYAHSSKPFAEFAWGLVQSGKEEEDEAVELLPKHQRSDVARMQDPAI